MNAVKPTLEAGRKTDALVAERVMGWTWLALPAMNDEQRALVPPGFRDASPARWWGHSVLELVPAYTADIAAAMQVVEKMRATFGLRGHNGFLLTTQGEGEPLWYCEFPAPAWGDGSADTPALAICRAALDALAFA